jgi:replication-associated recombination protein RarA
LGPFAFDLPTKEIEMTNPIPTPFDDGYLASSLLHKAVRRADVQWALTAARALHRIRGKNIWRRLVVIAFEDIGIGDPDLLSEITDLATSSKRGSEPSAADLDAIVERMCQATKERSADYLVSAAANAVHLELVRRHCASAPIADRLIILSDTTRTAREGGCCLVLIRPQRHTGRSP